MNKLVNMGVYTKNGEENIFNYYATLRSVDKLEFVGYVTDILIGENYNSIIRNLIFDYAIIKFITDFDTSDIDNSSNPINNIEDLLDETNIVDIVKVNAPELIDELNKAIDDNIAYRTGIHKNLIAESLSNLLNTIDRKVSGIDTEKMMEMAEILSNVSGELTADKAIDAYFKSDVFKQKQNELLENRSKSNAEIKTTKKSTKTSSRSKNSEKVVPMK